MSEHLSPYSESTTTPFDQSNLRQHDTAETDPIAPPQIRRRALGSTAISPNARPQHPNAFPIPDPRKRLGLGELPPKQDISHLDAQTPVRANESVQGFTPRPLPPHLRRDR